MGEAFAAAASAVQFLDIGITLVSSLYTGIQIVVQAPAHIQSLSREVRISKNILLSARRALQGLSIPPDHPISSIEEFIENGKESNKSLEVAINGLQQGDGVRRVKWVFERNKCRRLETEVKQHSEHAYKLVQLFATETYFKQMLRQFPELGRGGDVSVTVPAGAFIGPQSPNTLTWSPASEHSSLPELPASEYPASPEVPPSEYPPPPDLTPSSSEELLVTRKSSSTSQLVSPSRRCSLTCKCDCHTTLDRRYSKSFRRTSLHSRVGSLSHSRRCSIPECQPSKSRPKEFYFTLPLASFQKFFVLSIMWRGFKMVPSLKTRRFVSESSDSVQYTLKGDLESLKRLLELGLAGANDSELDGWTLLITATYYGIRNVAEYLIKEGDADPTFFDIKSRKASHFAMIKAVKRNASVDDIALAELFGPNVKEEFKKDFAFSPILVAVLNLYGQSVTERPGLAELLECAADANNANSNDEWAALELKYEGKSNPFWQIINRCRHDENKPRVYQDFRNENDAVHGWSPIHWAAYIGDLESVKILITKGAITDTITPSKRNLFHQAAESGNPDVIAYLLNSKYQGSLDINLPDLWQETSLHIAATYNWKSVSHLLDHGAKVDAVQSANQTPLHYAARANDAERPEIVKTLAKHDTYLKAINAVDDDGLTPIFLLLKSPECVTTLLEAGADFLARDKQDRTLIHYACREDQAESLRLLLEAGEFRWGIFMQRDSEGVTPLDEALKRGKAECAKLALRTLSTFTWDDSQAGRLLLGAAKIGDLDLLKQVLGLKLLDQYSMVRRAEEARRVAVEASKDKDEVRKLLDDLNRRKSLIPRESVSPPSKEEARAFYFVNK